MLTVYVIDDEPELCAMLRRGLMLDEFSVEVFSDPKEFLSGWRPAMNGCILCDVMMPGMNGLSLIELLQDRGCRLPFIIMTAHATLPMAAQAICLGAYDFLEKPFSMAKLRDKLNMAMKDPSYRIRKMEWSRQMCPTLGHLETNERKVFDFLAEGRTGNHIAQTLAITEPAVSQLRVSMMGKLGARNIADLVYIKMAEAKGVSYI